MTYCSVNFKNVYTCCFSSGEIFFVRDRAYAHLNWNPPLDFSYSFLQYCFNHIYDFNEESIDARKHLSYLDYHISFEKFNNKSILLPKELMNCFPYSFDCIQLKSFKTIRKKKDNQTTTKKEEKKQTSITNFF